MIVGEGSYRYEVDWTWGRGPEGRDLGIVSAIGTDARDRVYVLQRFRDPAVVVFDRQGRYLSSWGDGLFSQAHALWITPRQEMYLTDTKEHVVLKCTLDGKVLMTLGTKGQPGAPGMPFNRPTWAVEASGGDIFVSDGYGQDRVHRFSHDGKLVLSWGETGEGPGQFRLPHYVWVDRLGRVLVLDRTNNRVQIFDQAGRFLDMWTDIVPMPQQLYIDKNDTVYIAGGHGGIGIYTLDGSLITLLPTQEPGEPTTPYDLHSLWVDSHGDIYLSKLPVENRLHKYVRL